MIKWYVCMYIYIYTHIHTYIYIYKTTVVIKGLMLLYISLSIPVAERSKARNRGRSFAELRVRIPPGAWTSFSRECRVLPGRSLCDGPIPYPEQSYWLWCVTVRDLKSSSMRRPWPHVGLLRKGKEKNYSTIKLHVTSSVLWLLCWVSGKLSHKSH